MRIYRKDDRVLVTFRGRSVDAIVIVASENGRSLALQFEGLLGGYAGTMPVLWDQRAEEFRDLIKNERVEIRAEKTL